MFKILGKINRQAGMSYVELIVVLSIFSALSSVVVYDYGKFQAKIDIKNLASDIGLKIVQAQKAALSGSLPQVAVSSTWKPSYGVYFNLTTPKNFIYFTDLDQDGLLYNPNCNAGSECIENVSITKNNTISAITVFYQNGTSATINDVTVSFSRPNSGATIKSTTSFSSTVSYIQLTVLSPRLNTANIKVYPSGRIQVN